MKKLSNFTDNEKIHTKSSIDDLLDGGIEKGIITQFYGPPGSGKTNICLNVLVNAVKNGKKAIFIDTEGGISIERLKQIAGNNFDNISSNVIVFQPSSFQEQEADIKTIESWLASNSNEVELIILDSAVSLYRVTDMNSSRLNKELGAQIALLSKLANKYDIAVIITNQIYSAFNDDNPSQVSPVGGTILKYWSKVIVELEKLEFPGERKATLHRHRTKVEGLSINFKITNYGLK